MTTNIKTMLKVGTDYFNFKLGRPSPFFCLYVSTLRCNLKCKHCVVKSSYQDDLERKKYWNSLSSELTTEQAKFAIDQLKRIGISVLHISGGEPLLRKDHEEIARYAKTKGMYLSMDTNGVLMTRERAMSLACFDRIKLSVDGIGKTHELIRGENTFKKVVEAIDLLKKHTKCIITINFTINKLNYQEVDEALEFAKSHCDFITYLPIYDMKELYLDKKNAEEICEKIIALKNSNKDFIENPIEYLKLLKYFLQGKNAVDCNIDCHPFALYYTLGPSGDLSGCSSLSSKVGNILKDNIIEMHRQGISMRQDLRSKCNGCTTTCTIQNSLFFKQSIYKAALISSSKLIRK